MTTFQSMNHSSSLKKTRQQLHESELGVGAIPFDLKKSVKPIKKQQQTSPPVKTTCSSLKPIDDLKRKHKNDISDLRQEISSVKGLLSDAKKESHLKISSLSERLLRVSHESNNLKDEKIEALNTDSSRHAEKVESLQQELHSVQSSMKGLEKQLLAAEKESATHANTVTSKALQATHSYENKINNQDRQIRDLQAAVKQLTHMISAQSNVSTPIEVTKVGSTVQTLHIGNSFNLPEQPSVEKEGGIHKVAPLSLTVNGAVLFHDIGYTTDKKGLVPLFYDPVTNRVLFYQGK